LLPLGSFLLRKMKLFSKRYTPESLGNKNLLIQAKLRERLIKEVKFFVESKNFIEPFLLVNDEIDGRYYLYKQSLADLSVRELGYDLTGIINNSLELINDNTYSDFLFFDLLELLIIFSRNDKRAELVKRLQRILEEENSDFIISEFMIVHKKESGLKAIIPILKNTELKEKLLSMYGIYQDKLNYQSFARISADILQYLFSSPRDKKGTKSYSEDLCRKVASKWTEAKNVEALTDIFNEQVKQTKKMSNEISNIRHTDKSTIPVEGFSFYKLISFNNLSIIELVIQSLPEEYIISREPEQLKKDYFQNYGIKDGLVFTIEKPKDEEIVPDDIPF
jgi:hypothetical protein